MARRPDALKAALTLVIIFGTLSMIHALSTISLGSDDCQPALLCHDLIANHNHFLKNWHLVTDSFLLTDLPVYAFLGKFMGITSRTLRAGAWCIFAASVLLAALVSYQAFGKKAAYLTAAMLLSLSDFARGFVLRPFLHIGTICFSLLSVLIMLLSIKRRGEGKGTGPHLIALFLLSAAAAFSDPYFIFLFTVPAIFSFTVTTAKTGGFDAKSEAIMIASLLLPAAAGVMLQQWVKIFGLHIYSLARSLPAYPAGPDMLYLHFLFWVSSVLNLFGANFLAGIFPLSSAVPRFLAFLLFSITAMLTVQRLRGNIRDAAAFPLLWASAFTAVLSAAFIFMALPAERYLVPLLYGAALALGGTLGSARKQSENSLFRILTGIFLFIAACSTWAGFAGAASETPYGHIAKVLQEKGLTYGYASYRYGPVTTVLAQEKVKVRQVHFRGEAIKPFYWCAKDDWYRPKTHAGRTFLILGKREDPTFAHVTPDLILREFGKPVEVFPVEGAVVYVWPYNIAGRMPGVH